MTNVVVVESPAKAKTINKYLGGDYTVLASYGHIRDLPSKDGSVRPDDDFAMDWEMDVRAKKHVDAIAKAVKGADKLYLATDPDREGEAISWHVQEILRDRNALGSVEIERVVFNEITKNAVLDAFSHPRPLDTELIEAYLARRALDYLVGFTLSPVLWRKLPGSRSAGRVQSVALRIVCEREDEIENFKAQEYWSVKGQFATPRDEAFTAALTHLNGKKLTRMAIGSQAEAEAAKAAIEARAFSVAKVEKKQTRRNPAPPFTTSTLQQEAARKLYFGAKKTMQVAQKLYEGVNIGGETVGLITYMRTDGVQIANEALSATRAVIGRTFGDRYVPESPRFYKTKAKNAQEAHEAIRPTDAGRHPKDVAQYLDVDQRKLYELIWKRAMASQMEQALLDQVAVDIASEDQEVVLRATGSVVVFDGFLKLYREGRDEDERSDGEAKGEAKDETKDGAKEGAKDGDRILPAMAERDRLVRRQVTTEQHFTQPPPRYSEASLVKKLEELGIGRPSTYASILGVLQERNYVRLDQRRFIPEDRGRVVTAFLTSFFTRYVAYDFTADLEDKLDDISGGRIDWKQVLREFWSAFNDKVEETKDLRVSHVLDTLDELLGPHFFREGEDGIDPRKCPSCDSGRLNLKLGKFGAFIGCANYPDCRFTRPLEVVEGGGNGNGMAGPVVLGDDPATGLAISLRKGPYGFYVQLGDIDPEDKKKKPKRASLLKGTDPASIDLERALGLLSLPRTLGPDPESGDEITAGIGRFGPYVKRGGTYVSLKGDDDVMTIQMNRACHLLASKPRRDPPKELGLHPKGKKPITVRDGRYGPYVQHGRTMATIPKGQDKDTVTLEQAVELIAAKSGKGAAKKTAKKPAKKKAAKKKSAKKPAKKAAKSQAAPGG